MAASVPIKAVSGMFGLAGFAIAVIAGLTAGNPGASVLMTALVASVACYGVGFLAGLVVDFVVQEHLRNAAANSAERVSGGGQTVDQSVGGSVPTVDNGKVAPGM